MSGNVFLPPKMYSFCSLFFLNCLWSPFKRRGQECVHFTKAEDSQSQNQVCLCIRFSVFRYDMVVSDSTHFMSFLCSELMLKYPYVPISSLIVASSMLPLKLLKQKQRDHLPQSVFTIPPELDVSLILDFVGWVVLYFCVWGIMLTLISVIYYDACKL